MSLLRDYLEKTTPQARQGQDAQVPPMLRQDKKKGTAGLRRLMPVMVVLLVLVFFSGYIFKTSFKALTVQPPKIVSMADAAPEVKPAVSKDSTPSVALNTPSREIKSGDLEPDVIREQAPLPVKVEASLPVVAVKQTAVISQTKTPETLQAEEKLQAAMESYKSEIRKPDMLEKQKKMVPEQYTKPPVAGPDDYFNLGLAAQKQGALDQALGYYRKVLNLKPDHSKALLNLSAIHIKTGNTARAMSILDKLYRQEPENVDAMVNLGILFLQEKNYARAESLLEKALDLQGHNTAGSLQPGLFKSASEPHGAGKGTVHPGICH